MIKSDIYKGSNVCLSNLDQFLIGRVADISRHNIIKSIKGTRPGLTLGSNPTKLDFEKFLYNISRDSDKFSSRGDGRDVLKAIQEAK